MQYLLTDNTTIGATYQSASAFNLRGTAHVALPAIAGGSSFTYDSDIRIKWPQSVAAGLRHTLCPHRTIAADVVWYDWSHSFNQLDVTLQNSSAPLPFVPFTLPLNWQS